MTEQALPAQLVTPTHVYNWLAARMPVPGRITGASFFCAPDSPERILCLIDVAGVPASAVAATLGGQPFGFSSVIVTLPADAGFTCRSRRGGAFTACDQCSCNPAPAARTPPVRDTGL